MADQGSQLKNRLEGFSGRLRPLLPGLLLAGTIAAAASFLSEHYATPVMLLALLIGMAFNFLAEDEKCQKGIEFAAKDLLRFGIILLGARITLGDISSLGITTFFTVIGLIGLTIGSGFLFAKLFNRGWRFAILTGGSVAICGASAALAMAALIPANDKTERNTLFTVIAVTTLSTAAMVLYPILFSMFDLTPREMGFLIGATIHDVAQVVGAGYLISIETGDTATIVKLLRVAMLPVVLVVLLMTLPQTKEGAGRPQLPFFVVGFLLVVAANSFGFIPQPVIAVLIEMSRWCLIVAISALGVKTSMQKMLQLGFGHVAVVFAETVFLLLLAIFAVKTFLVI